MVTDNQVKILKKLINQEQKLQTAAAKAGMSEKTARKWRDSKELPSQCKIIHDWPTHPDVFAEDWPWAEDSLKTNSGVEAKTLFEALQRRDWAEQRNSVLESAVDIYKRNKILPIS